MPLVAREPKQGDWAEDGLEVLGACPVCESTNRSLLYGGLVDAVFFDAPGKWRLWRCGGCGAGYLDPRPTPQAIHLAYGQHYFTHAGSAYGDAVQEHRRSAIGRLRQRLRNDYLNAAFGYDLAPAHPLGRWLMRTAFRERRYDAETHIRHLPAPETGGSRLLDVGCADGWFVHFAGGVLGYESEGLEVDEIAAGFGRQRGDVIHLGRMPGSDLPEGIYDQVTLSHVVEHLHDPVSALEEVFRLLRPGGRVWIQTPNLNAASIARFGSSSRLLEPPRHLVLFEVSTLADMLNRAGFVKLQQRPLENPSAFVYSSSWAIAGGYDPSQCTLDDLPHDVQLEAKRDRRAYSGIHPRGEFITVTAYKP